MDSFPSIIEWCLQVTEIPEEIKIVEFNKGISNGLKGITFSGGQIAPISMLGDKLLWKKAQKNEIKKNTSDKINNNIPNLRPFNTKTVWNPWKEASRETSRHHWKDDKIKIIIAKIDKI